MRALSVRKLHSFSVLAAATVRRHWLITAIVLLFMGTEYLGQRYERFNALYAGDDSENVVYSPLAFRGTPSFFRPDENSYLIAGLRTRWNLWPMEPYLYENREETYFYPILTSAIVAVVTDIVGDIDNAYRLLKIIGFGLIPLAVYVLVVGSAGGIRLGLVCMAIVACLPSPWKPWLYDEANIMEMLSYLTTPANPDRIYPPLTRFPFPALSLPMLTAFIGAMGHALHTRKTSHAVIAGIAVGIQPLIYQYNATATALGMAILFAWYLAQRDRGAVTVMVIAGAIALVVAIPAFVQAWKLQQIPSYSEYLGTSYGQLRRGADWRALVYLVPAVLMWAGAMRMPGRWRTTFLVILSTIIASGLLLNLHLVTGLSLQPAHWVIRILVPLLPLACAMFAAMVVRQYVQRRRAGRTWLVVSTAVTAAVVMWGVSVKIVANRIENAERFGPVLSLPKGYAQGYDWLRENAPSDAVVTCLGIEQTYMIPQYARTFVYLPNYAVATVSLDEILGRWANVNRFYGVPLDTALNIMDGDRHTRDLELLAERDEPWWYERRTTLVMLLHFRLEHTRHRLTTDLIERIERLYGSGAPADDMLREFRADYIWQGRYERSIGADRLDEVRNVELVYENADVRIYRVL